jgi:plastocyanin
MWRWLVAVAVAVGGVVVSPDAASAGGGGCHLVLGGEGPTEATGTTVELQAACMSPTVLRVEPGTDVTFVNRDEMTHNLFGAGLSVSELTFGQSASLRYEEPGTYPFACTLHVGMVGAVVVGDGRFADGAATLTTTATTSMPPTTTTAAPLPLVASRPLTRGDDDDVTSTVIVTAAVTLFVLGLGYRFGRRSASLGAHDRADR